MPPYYRPAARLGRVPVPDGAAPAPSTARSPAGSCATSARSSCPPRPLFDEVLQRVGQPVASHHHGLHPPAAEPVPRRARSAPGWCRSSPTRPAPSAWTRCSGSSKIYAAQGQRYEPVDHDLLLSYTEAQDGQILEEGITEAGSMASFIAAATSYAHRGVPMVPFYIFYSMFGFQRIGDLIWLAADARARGFLLGATAGRTTLPRRGPAAPGRPQPRAGLDRARVPGLRPGLRLRGGGDRASTASAACTAPTRRTSSTT